MTRPLTDERRQPTLKLVDDEPLVLPYKRDETAAEIAYRLRNGIKRAPMFVKDLA